MQNASGLGDPSSFWTFLAEVLKEHGAITVALLFGMFVFWRLIWRVWDRAMKAKDEEIDRLVIERDKYQKLVFDRLLSSEIDKPETP